MSEYQYYEFLAIDRPLTHDEMKELRQISSRARITSVSFTNEYHYGSFSGDPNEFMRRWFDAHVYLSGWGSAVFMVRLPIESLMPQVVEAVVVDGLLDIDEADDHWVATWSRGESGDYGYLEENESQSWMARLAPIRDELLRGDTRSLYLGWLAAVDQGYIEEDKGEPWPAEGLGNLTAAQKALADFLEVNEDLLAGAGMGSPDRPADEPSDQEKNAWLAALPAEEVQSLMKMLLAGEGLKTERWLRNRFTAWRRQLQEGGLEERPGRTVAQLRENLAKAQELRLKKERKDRERIEAQRRKERELYLTVLAKDFSKVWDRARANVLKGIASSYDTACQTLVDLSDAYTLHSTPEAFTKELGRFMADYLKRKSFIERLVKAGIWKG